MTSAFQVVFEGSEWYRPGGYLDLTKSFWTLNTDPAVVRNDLGWRTVDDVLCGDFSDPDMFRLIGKEGRIHPERFASRHSGYHANQWHLHAASLNEMMIQGGATLTVDGIDTVSDAVRRNREVLEYLSHQQAWCNAFVSVGSGSAFDWHRDEHETLIVQGGGGKHWQVQDPSGEQIFDSVITPGTLLHVPTGWLHRVSGIGGASLHWTFGWHAPTLRSAVRDDWRYLNRLGESGIDSVEDVLMTEGQWDTLKRVRSPSRRNGISLFWGTASPAVEQGCYAVRWAATHPPVVRSDASDLVVESLGKRVRVGEAYSEIVERLMRGSELCHEEFIKAGLSIEDIQMFVEWGYSADVLLVRAI